MGHSVRKSPSVPYGADETIYVVIDDRSKDNKPREVEVERTDFEAVLSDLMAGTFVDPVRVVAFNTLEHWSDDVSTTIAHEIQCRCDMEGCGIPQYLTGFMETYIGPRQAPHC